ncbi:hypothetical protein S83_060226 [Arachis hypogaea]
MYGSVRRAVDRNGLVVPHSRLQWGLLFFFFGRVCQYDLNEVRGFTSDIRWASLFRSLRPGIFVHAINPSGQRLVVGGPAELSEKGSLVCKHSNEPRRTLR